MSQVLQIVGALFLLAAFAATRFRLLDARAYSNLLLNVVGSSILWSVVGKLTGREPAPIHE